MKDNARKHILVWVGFARNCCLYEFRNLQH